VSERRTDDTTLIQAVRILSRTIQTDDGVIGACLAEAATRLEELVEDRRWVPVGDRLPEDLRRVMVMVPGLYGAQVAWLRNGKWRDGIGCGDEPIGCRVTHWQPLPPGPEGNS
jgi:hypothetical protein